MCVCVCVEGHPVCVCVCVIWCEITTKRHINNIVTCTRVAGRGRGGEGGF